MPGAPCDKIAAFGIRLFYRTRRKFYCFACPPDNRCDATGAQAAAGPDDNVGSIDENDVDWEAHTKGVNLSATWYHQSFSMLHALSPDEAPAALARCRRQASIRREEGAL